jgi:nucleoside-diphosphate-sugar epimerase
VSTCLVTGGSGYFGSLLVRRLVDEGHSVRVLDLKEADDLPPAVDFVGGDIRDRAVVDQVVDDVEIVFHNLAQVPHAKALELLRTVHVDGTAVLLEAC